jgi:hypothetical protein
MRADEEFVGSALVEYFGGSACACVREGDDPPDLYLTLNGVRVGVEVTRVSQFTVEPDGALGDRATQDAYGLRVVNELDTQVGPCLPSDKSLLVTLQLPVTNVRPFRRKLAKLLEQIAKAPVEDSSHDATIEGSPVTVSVIPRRPSGKSVVGIIANRNSSADIGFNALLVLTDRIRTKSEICADLPKPVWLALLNDYWLADAVTYANAARQLDDGGCFQRVFIVSDQGSVNELRIGA